jgi:carbon storage regulator
MLILSRKVGEQIVIGDGIRLIVNRVSGERVTLGLEAPADVKILRGELRPFDDTRRNAVKSSSGRHVGRRDPALETPRVPR